MIKKSDHTVQLVDFIVKTDFQDLPEDVIDFIKRDILDTLAIALGGSSSQGCPEIVDMVRGWGGNQQSTILVHGGKCPAPMAASANSVMSRALDMGDTHPEAAHIGEYELFPLLAMAEMNGGVTGREFLTAYALGFEAACRIGAAAHAVSAGLPNGRHPCIGPFGSTAAIARLLDMDAESTGNALGIHYVVSGCWDMQMYDEGTLMIRAHHGFTAEDAINAVLMAQRGITGPKNIFSGKNNFFARLFPWNNDPDLLIDDLGKHWEMLNTMLKPYASCKFTHTSIDGIIDLVKEHHIQPEDIGGITCTLCHQGNVVIEPRDVRWNPKTMPECQFSLPYTVATGAIKQKVFLDDYEPQEITRTDVRDLMGKIEASTDDQLPLWAAEVKAVLSNGEEYSKRVEHARGGPEVPLTWDDLEQKFHGCARYAAKPIPTSNLEQAVDMIRHLEDSNNASHIMELLTP